MHLNKDQVYVLNPDYVLRNDIHRIALYAKESVNAYSSRNWNSFIHPIHAKLFSFFTYDRTLGENIELISSFFKKDVDSVSRLISPYLENTTPIYVNWKGKRILFPKNVLVQMKHLTTPFTPSQLTKVNFDCQEIDLDTRRYYSGPLMVTFMLNNTCVTHCVYCYADVQTKVQHLVPTYRWLELIQEAKLMQVRQINLMGGEIFMHKDWDILLKELVDQGMSPEYLSTKKPLTKDLIIRLQNTGYRNCIQVSLDAYDVDVLSKSLGVDKGYLDRMERGIRLLDDSGLPYHIATVLHVYNGTEKALRVLFDFLLSLRHLSNWRISLVVNSIMINYGQFAELKLSKRQIDVLFHYVDEVLSPRSSFPILLNSIALDRSYYACTIGSKGFEGTLCSALNTHLFVLPDGQATICEQLYWNSRFIIGDVMRSTLKEIWKSERSLKLAYLQKNDLQKNSLCKNCELLESCYGNRNRCWSDIIKAYGVDNWDYPDPRCKNADKMINNLDYF